MSFIAPVLACFGSAALPWHVMLFMLAGAAIQGAPFNSTRFHGLPHVQKLLEDSHCLSRPSVCSSRSDMVVSRADRQSITGVAAGNTPEWATACEYCSHGAHMLPLLIRHYRVKSLVEIGVCTGMSVVHVVTKSTGTRSGANVQVGDEVRMGRRGGLERYYLIDPWGGMKCKPGCACSRQINQIAKTWPDVIIPLRGYSVPMAAHIPNGTLDLAFIDAAHDFRNVRADIIAFWPKLKSTGILAGHDFAHWRNYAEIRQDKLAARGAYSVRHAVSRKPGAQAPKTLPPAYGVVQATQELFAACHVHVRWNTWWVERETCELHELLTAAEIA